MKLEKIPDFMDYTTLNRLLPQDSWWKRVLRKFGLYKTDAEQEWALIEQQLQHEAQFDAATIRELTRNKTTRRLCDLVKRS